MNEYEPTPEERRADLICALLCIAVLIFLAFLAGAFTYLSLDRG